MAGPLEGRSALVTGSSSGIGRGIALGLAAAGARVCVHGRDEGRSEAVRSEVEATGVGARVAVADLTDEAAVTRLAAEYVEAWGAPDVLVANAGGNPVPPGPIEEIPVDGWRAAVEGNLTATFLTLKAFLPAMKERGSGSVVAVSSLAARSPHERSPAAYAAAKAGIESLVGNLAVQAGPAGIRVNAVAPETIMTERNEQMIPQEIREGMIAAHPIRRLGTVEDVAAAVVYLAGDAAGWVTGQVIDIAGGPT